MKRVFPSLEKGDMPKYKENERERELKLVFHKTLISKNKALFLEILKTRISFRYKR
jgi:hypothetical protein